MVYEGGNNSASLIELLGELNEKTYVMLLISIYSKWSINIG